MIRARGKIACFVSSRETGSTVARARMPRGSRMRKRMRQPAHRTTVSHRRRRAFRRCNVLPTGPGRPRIARHGARARKACVLFLLLRDRQRSGACARARRGRRLRKVEATAGTLHHGLASKEIRFPPVPFPSNVQREITNSAARRARAASSGTSPLPERQTDSEVARARVPRKCRLCVGGRRWHIAPRSRTVEGGLSAGEISFQRARTDHNQRDTARALGKLACFASSRGRLAAQRRARACHAKSGCGPCRPVSPKDSIKASHETRNRPEECLGSTMVGRP